MLVWSEGCVSEVIWAWLRVADLVEKTHIRRGECRRYRVDDRQVRGAAAV